MQRTVLIFVLSLFCIAAHSQINPKLNAKLEAQVKEIEPRMIEWRRYFHEHPELSNRENKTGARIAEQ
ncbi:MAG: amidohydrolase, partial [Bacteroidota bacterium]